MGVDLLGIFKTYPTNLIGLKVDTLLSETDLVLGESSPFGLALTYIDPKTDGMIDIPLESIGEKMKIADDKPLFFHLWLNHGMEYNKDKNGNISKISLNLQWLIEKSKVLYRLSKPEFGFCGYDLGFEPYYWHFNDCIMWLNFFGPELVKKYGKNSLLSAPAYKVEELPDGGVFIQASVGPSRICFSDLKDIDDMPKEELDLYDEDVQLKKIRKHLGVEEAKK